MTCARSTNIYRHVSIYYISFDAGFISHILSIILRYNPFAVASTITSSVVDDHSASNAVRSKSIDRCKYYPSCGKGDNCEFHHPVSSCKQFPNCKFGDQCLYFHPKCKFDLTCNRHGCNFSHSMDVSGVAPPLCKQFVLAFLLRFLSYA